MTAEAGGWSAYPVPTEGDFADWLLGWLAEHGVEIIFGNPGSTELPLMDALPRQSRIRYVLGLHEAAVMGMADGYAQQGGRLAVVNVHVQPGLANAMSGILNAARARVPILVTVGQQVTELKDQAPFLGGELVAMAAPIAKGALELTGSVRSMMQELGIALMTALTHPRGPAVVSMPMDVQAGPEPTVVSGVRSSRPPPGQALVERAATMLRDARSPIILAGDGVVHERASDALVALAERLGAPIMGEPFAARVPVLSAHPLWRGPLPGFTAEIAPILEGHDVVFAIGMPVFRVFGHSPGEMPRLPVRLIHVDPDEDEVGRIHRPKVGIAAPCAPVLDRIVGALGPVGDGWPRRRSEVETRTLEMRRAATQRLLAEAEGSEISPAVFCLAVARAVAPDDLVVDEALTSGRWLRTALVERNTPHNWLAHRGSALGWGLPAAVGAKLADPSRRVMCVHGDGSYLFGVHALWTAARERLGVAVVVADNGGYEILRAGLEGLTGRAEGGWPGLAIADPPLDLVAISRGFGASAERIERRDQLDDALGDLWRRAEEGPAVLVVPVSGRTPAVGYPVATGR